jgi:hypothetical protein
MKIIIKKGMYEWLKLYMNFKPNPKPIKTKEQKIIYTSSSLNEQEITNTLTSIILNKIDKEIII